MTTNNIEKILAMLTMESIKVRETEDLKQIEDLYLEIQRFIKTEYTKLMELRDGLYLEALNGQEEATVNGYSISYRSLQRFAIDSAKLEEYCERNKIDLKSEFYSHSITKPSLKIKAAK